MTNLSTTAVWEHLKEGGDINELLKDVPDEFYKKVKKYESELKYAFYRISEDIGKTFDYKMYGKYNDKEPLTDRKEFAEWVQTQPKHYQGILFRMFDKRNYSELIWKLLKPEFKKL
jgi:RNA ligase